MEGAMGDVLSLTRREQLSDGADPSQVPMCFTIFADVYAKTKLQQSCTWGKLVQELTAKYRLPDDQAAPTKEACRLIKLSTFGEVPYDEKGCLRHDANLLEIHGIEGDYDDEKVSVEDALRMLQVNRIEAFIYTSASHGVVTYYKDGRERSHGGIAGVCLCP